MAKYGAYSTGVPTTTGAGQGSAQLFTPTEHKRVDTSNLQTAIGGLGDTFAAQNEAKAKADAADAADKAAKAKRDAELRKRENGEFAVSQGAITEGAKLLEERYVNAELSEEEFVTGMETLQGNAKALQDYDKGILQPEQVKFNTDENALIYVDGKWVSHAEGTDWLGQSPDEELSKLIKEDPDLSTAVPYIQRKHGEGQQNFGVKDPNFSLAGAAFSDAAWNSFKQSADETTQATIQEMERQNYDKETIIKRTASAEAYKDHLKQRSDIMGKWTKQQKFDEGLSNQYINYMLTTDNIPYVQQAYEEAIDNLILPEGKKEVTYKNVQTGNRTKSEGKDFKVSIYDVDSGDSEELAKTLMESHKGSWNSLVASGIPKSTVDKLREDFKNETAKKLKGLKGLKKVQITTDGTGKDLPPITLGQENGVVKDIYVTPEGKGIVVMTKLQTVTYSKGGTTAGKKSANEKVAVDVVVELTPDKLDRLQSLYGFDLAAEPQEERTTEEQSTTQKFKASNGYEYTEKELMDAGWTKEQIKGLK
tara:strand:+ start:7734 stop:9338 length:1605 start_codon:yes stop_codon:yes gene_type:complete